MPCPGLREYLQEHRGEWQGAFPAGFGDPPYETVYLTLTSTMEMPDVGDAAKLAEVVGLTERMVGAMVPLLVRYFETRDLSAEATQAGR